MFKVKIKKSALTVIDREPLAAGASKVYHVTFIFDEEWDGLSKNAVFKAGDRAVSILLESDTCEIPWEVLDKDNIGEPLWVGVFGSDTEGVKLPTVWNILEIIQPGAELSGSGSEPTPTIVSQIYEAAKNAEQKAGEASEKAAGAQNYAKEAEASALSAKQCLESAAKYSEEAYGYAIECGQNLEAAVNIAKETEDTASNIKNEYSNAVKGTLLGAAVAASDVSPNEHDLSVKVSSKNLIPYPYSTGSKTNSGITFTVNDDRTITVSGTAESATNFVFANKNSDITLENGKYYTLSGAGTAMAYQLPDGTYKYLSANKSVLWSSDYAFVHIYYNIPNGTTLDNVIIPAPQFEVGTSATEYAPYVDVEGVNVRLTDGENEQTATSDAEGNVTGLISASPNMTLTSDTENVIIECEYNRDLMKVIEELTQAIISLGGNI